MTQEKLHQELVDLIGKNDFMIILNNKSHSENWGCYYPRHRLIEIYNIHEGKELDDDSQIRIALHELTHHLQFKHFKEFDVEEGNEHDEKFKKVFAKLLIMYYNGHVPVETIEIIRREGLYNELYDKKRLPRGITKNFKRTLFEF